MTADRYFLDTNVLVYANDRTEPRRQRRALELITQGIRSRNAVVSTQVLSEFWVTVTGKIQVPLDGETAEKEINRFRSMVIVSVEYETVMTAVHIHRRFRVSYWDALIIAAAQHAGCRLLYSEDMSAGQSYGDITVANPFAGPA